MFRRSLLRLAATAMLVLLARQAWAAPIYLWEARRGDAVVVLFGSVHLCSDACYPLPAPVRAALRRSRALAVEIDATNKAALAPLMRRAVYGEGDGVANHLPAELATRYTRALTEHGIPEAVAGRMKPWFGTMLLESAEAASAGYAPEKGIDLHLIGLARAARKPVLELESVEEQIGVLESMSGDDETALTQQMLDMLGHGTISSYVGDLLESWRKGDAESLYARSVDMFPDAEMGKRTMAALLEARNRTMAERLARHVARYKRVFVVIGAGHLAGPGSVQSLLEAAGYRVRQIDDGR